MAVEHRLKTWPSYFDAMKRGEKTFEVRRDDRGFQKGDILVLQRTQEENVFAVDWVYGSDPLRAKQEMRRRVVYVLTGGRFGIEPGYVVMQTEADN